MPQNNLILVKGILHDQVVVLNISLARNPWEDLLHKPIPTPTTNQGKLMRFVFLAARQALARVWRQPYINSAEVKQKLMGIMVHEKCTSILKDYHAKFIKV